MQVSVSVLWHVVVEDDVDALDVHSTAKQVGGDQNPLLEVLELLVPSSNCVIKRCMHLNADAQHKQTLIFYQQ